MEKTENSLFRAITVMAVIGAFGVLAYLVLAHATGAAVSEETKSENIAEQTKQNLSTAMHGEAFAYVKYMLYAEQARRTGQPELAALFEKTAHTERFEHFAEEAELAGLVGTNEENLRDAIKGESYEVTTMYKQFAEEAQRAGDHAAAARFREVRADEMTHLDAYKVALQKLGQASSESTGE